MTKFNSNYIEIYKAGKEGLKDETSGGEGGLKKIKSFLLSKNLLLIPHRFYSLI